MEDIEKTAAVKHSSYTRRLWFMFGRYKWILLLLVVLGALGLWGPTVYDNLSTRGERYDTNKTALQNIPKNRVAIVFGAGIYKDGTPTPYLQWRIETAAKLYKAGRIQKVLMTGDNSRKGYDEPTAMMKFALKEGIKASDITLDYAGFNTYDSCYRAHTIFGLTKATLISQGYHLPRAVTACKGLGIDSIGVDAINHGRDWAFNYTVREWASTDKISAQLIFKPHPTALGKPESIK